MLTLKQSIELDFQTNIASIDATFTTSNLHIYGYRYDSTGIASYIRLRILPLADEIQSVDNLCDEESLTVEVTSYGSSLHNVVKLSDEVISFMKASTAFNIKTSISFDQNELDENVWYQTVRATAYIRT